MGCNSCSSSAQPKESRSLPTSRAHAPRFLSFESVEDMMRPRECNCENPLIGEKNCLSPASSCRLRLLPVLCACWQHMPTTALSLSFFIYFFLSFFLSFARALFLSPGLRARVAPCQGSVSLSLPGMGVGGSLACLLAGRLGRGVPPTTPARRRYVSLQSVALSLSWTEKPRQRG